MNPRHAFQRAAAAQSAAAEREKAYARVTAICKSIEAHIARHGADGLVEACAVHAGESTTVKVAILGVVLRQLGRDSRDAVREVLP